ncbi:MAG: DCC1-like thiol-disulfide oxidoreductase family protein [Anaerolineales bacterium]
MMAAPLVLYDGYCVLCSRSVQFMQARQRPGTLDYASQHSQRGQAALKSCSVPIQNGDMLIFFEKGRCFQRSTAALRALRYLRFPWFLLSALILIPRFLRDPVYNLIANNRYRWFGRLPRG